MLERTVIRNATPADVKTVRALLTPIAKAHGVKVSVRKGTGSVSGTVAVQPGEYVGSDKALQDRHLGFRIAAAEALMGNWEDMHVNIETHVLRLAREFGHSELRVHLVPASSVSFVIDGAQASTLPDGRPRWLSVVNGVEISTVRLLDGYKPYGMGSYETLVTSGDENWVTGRYDSRAGAAVGHAACVTQAKVEQMC